MNFIACIVKSAGSKVSANDLMYSLIILDKSHGKSPRDSFITPTDCRLAWAFAVRAKHNSDLLVILGKSYPGGRENDSHGVWFSAKGKGDLAWLIIAASVSWEPACVGHCTRHSTSVTCVVTSFFLQKGNWGSSFSRNTPHGRYHKWWLN